MIKAKLRLITPSGPLNFLGSSSTQSPETLITQVPPTELSNHKKENRGPVIRWYSKAEAQLCGAVNFKAPLIIKDMDLENSKGPRMIMEETKSKDLLGKGKGIAGLDESFYSADSDLSPVEGECMDIDKPDGPAGLGQTSKEQPTSILRSGKSRLKKSTQKILCERAKRSRIRAKKHIDWVGKFWAKLKITDGTRKNTVIPKVGEKLETIEEDSED